MRFCQVWVCGGRIKSKLDQIGGFAVLQCSTKSYFQAILIIASQNWIMFQRGYILLYIEEMPKTFSFADEILRNHDVIQRMHMVPFA